MAKYCPRCGAQTEETDRFCRICGNSIQFEHPTQTGPIAYQQQPDSNQIYSQESKYIQPQQKKSYSKIIGALIGVIAIIIIIVILFLFVFNGVSDQFTGTWQISSMKMDGIETPIGSASITFNSDGTLISDSSGFTSMGTWEVKNNKLYISSTDSNPSSFDNIGFDYSFSESNRLILSYTGIIPNEDDLTHSIQIILVLDGTYNDSQNGNQNGNEDTSKFIGTWNYEYPGYGNLNIIVKSDYTLEIEYSGFIYGAGSWSLNNEEICLTTTEDIFETGSAETTQCFDYSFSNADNTLTLTATGIEDIILTK